MPVRLKTLIGGIALVILVAIYCIVSVTIATATMSQSSGWAHLVFFATTGLLWLLPAMVLIRWMYTPPKPRNGAQSVTK